MPMEMEAQHLQQQSQIDKNPKKRKGKDRERERGICAESTGKLSLRNGQLCKLDSAVSFVIIVVFSVLSLFLSLKFFKQT